MSGLVYYSKTYVNECSVDQAQTLINYQNFANNNFFITVDITIDDPNSNFDWPNAN